MAIYTTVSLVLQRKLSVRADSHYASRFRSVTIICVHTVRRVQSQRVIGGL